MDDQVTPKAGFYWNRGDDRAVVLNVREASAKGHWFTWPGSRDGLVAIPSQTIRANGTAQVLTSALYVCDHFPAGGCHADPGRSIFLQKGNEPEFI